MGTRVCLIKGCDAASSSLSVTVPSSSSSSPEPKEFTDYSTNAPTNQSERLRKPSPSPSSSRSPPAQSSRPSLPPLTKPPPRQLSPSHSDPDSSTGAQGTRCSANEGTLCYSPTRRTSLRRVRRSIRAQQFPRKYRWGAELRRGC